MEFFWNDVIVTGNHQKWYHVWRNDRMISPDHISAKKHIVGVSLRLDSELYPILLEISEFSKNFKAIVFPSKMSTNQISSNKTVLEFWVEPKTFLRWLWWKQLKKHFWISHFINKIRLYFCRFLCSRTVLLDEFDLKK